jgi:transglutaminase-like putative cysteine protease
MFLVGAISFGISLSRRARVGELRPSTDRRARPQGNHGAGWWLLLHAAMIGAGAAPFLWWARGSGGSDAMSLVAVTAAAVGLLFGTRSGLTITTACSAGGLALALATPGGLGGWGIEWQSGSGLGAPLATLTTVAILVSCAMVARLGLAELATGPNVPLPFGAPPTDKRGVGLFQTPKRAAVIPAVALTLACVASSLALEPFVSPLTNRLGNATADRITGATGAGQSGQNGNTVFKGAQAKDQSSGDVLGANDSFAIDDFGATSDAEVLRVTFNVERDTLFRPGAKIPRDALLKGQSFDRWDGNRWFSTAEVVRTLKPRELAFDPLSDPARAQDFFTTRVQVMKGSTNLIFGPSRLVQVDLPDQQLLLKDDDSMLSSTAMGVGTQYLAITARHPFRDSVRNTPLALLTTSQEEMRTYGVRNEHFDSETLSPRSVELARSLGNGQTTIQGVADEIDQWLASNTSYDFSVRHSSKNKNDVVDQFLFETKAGWCEQIATSAVMMLRANGIPARLATGYLPSEVGTGGTLSVLGRDAHAWVEYYVPGYGWAQRDPTQSVPVAKLPPPREMRSAPNISGRWLVYLLGAIVALLAGWMALQRRRQAVSVSAVDRSIAKLERFGQDRDRQRVPHETLTEYGRSLDAVLKGASFGPTREAGKTLVDQPVSKVVALLERQRFDPDVDTENLENVNRLLAELEAHFPIKSKRI